MVKVSGETLTPSRSTGAAAAAFLSGPSRRPSPRSSAER